jgi:hypothetical protein
MSLFDTLKIVGKAVREGRKNKKETEKEIQASEERIRKLKEKTAAIRPETIYFFHEGARIVRLTDEGYKKVGHRTIHSTHEQVRPRGAYLYVTDRDSGKTYILNAHTDIESIEQE